MINTHWEEQVFEIQEGGPQDWWRVADTSLPSPDDFLEPGFETPAGGSYRVAARSVVILRTASKRTVLD
jgi:hypothetical protein